MTRRSRNRPPTSDNRDDRRGAHSKEMFRKRLLALQENCLNCGNPEIQNGHCDECGWDYEEYGHES